VTSTFTTRSSHSHRSSRAQTKNHRTSRSGQFNPVLVDDIPDLDYTPPEGSRAARVLQQARREGGSKSVSPGKDTPVVNFDTPGLPRLSFISGHRRVTKPIERLQLHPPAKEPEKEVDWEWNKDPATQNKEEESERNLGTHTVRQRTLQMLTALGIL
jgi:hypothetical protein